MWAARVRHSFISYLENKGASLVADSYTLFEAGQFEEYGLRGYDALHGAAGIPPGNAELSGAIANVSASSERSCRSPRPQTHRRRLAER